VTPLTINPKVSYYSYSGRSVWGHPITESVLFLQKEIWTNEAFYWAFVMEVAGVEPASELNYLNHYQRCRTVRGTKVSNLTALSRLCRSRNTFFGVYIRTQLLFLRVIRNHLLPVFILSVSDSGKGLSSH